MCKNIVIEATCPVTVYQSDEAKIFLKKSYGLLYLEKQTNPVWEEDYP